LSRPAVSAVIVGATRQQHISDAVSALPITLDVAEMQQLESPYLPHPPGSFT
jgi:1-deoxyxylulose-5-phosphate synthase